MGARPTDSRCKDLVDKLDYGIIKLLSIDGRKKLVDIGRELGIRHPTVKERLNRLMSKEVLRVQANVNPEKLGLITLFIEASVEDSEKASSFLRKLSQCPKVCFMAMSSGVYNVIMAVVDRDYNSLTSFVEGRIRRMPGLRDLRVYPARIVKPVYMPLSLECSSREEDYCTACTYPEEPTPGGLRR